MQDAEDERVRIEEERIAAEEKAEAEEKERKRKAKQEKKEAQVAAGTYMTKAEKEKAKKLQARLDSMKAAGIQLPTSTADPAAAANVKATDLYKKTAPKNKSASSDNLAKVAATSAMDVTKTEEPTTPAAAPASQPQEAEVADDWDADDDWEANMEQIQLNLEVRKEQAEEDVEDRIVVEKKREQEKLKLLGIERAKREEEARIKR